MISDERNARASETWHRVHDRNRQTRALTTYGSHRDRVMELVSSLRDQSPKLTQSIAVLGAGNCLDLDLPALVRTSQRVELIDLDAEALEFGVSRQISAIDPGVRNNIHRRAPVDLAEPLTQLTQDDFDDPRWMDTCSRLESVHVRDRGIPVDCVVSACVLSQIIDSLSLLVGPQHPRLPVVLQAVRRGHLNRMLEWLVPSGIGLLITDVVSSDTAPGLAHVPDQHLPLFLQQCLQMGNFFAGLHPGHIMQDLTQYEPISSRVRDVAMHPPWKWQMGPRFYAVCAVSFCRRTQQMSAV
jgi:hypothetical protein